MTTSVYLTIDKDPFDVYRVDVYDYQEGFIISSEMHKCPVDAITEAVDFCTQHGYTPLTIDKCKGWP